MQGVLLKPHAFRQRSHAESLGRPPPVSGQNQHYTGQAGPKSKLHIRELVADNKALLREQSISCRQLVPHAGPRLSAGAPVVRGMRAKNMVRKENMPFSQ